MSLQEQITDAFRSMRIIEQNEKFKHDFSRLEYSPIFYEEATPDSITEDAEGEQEWTAKVQYGVREADAPDDSEGDRTEKEKKRRKRRALKRFGRKIVRLLPRGLSDYFKVISILEKVHEYTRKDMKNASKNPEIQLQATVRRGNRLCDQEQRFLEQRKKVVRAAFAKYMGVPLDEVHEEDVPVIGFGGSGGGYRAMINSSAFLNAAKRTGLYDCLTYLAGVSGSTWALMCLYSVANGSTESLVEHLIDRLDTYPASPTYLFSKMLIPDIANLMFSGLEIKTKTGSPITSMDMYGVLVAGHILLDKENRLRPEHWKLSHQAKWLTDAIHPMPIYTAIRHERPWINWESEQAPFSRHHNTTRMNALRNNDAWFQWFEFTPFEIGCDELAAWIPTWSFGRTFERGVSTNALPEQGIGLSLGIFSSALSAPLSAYFDTMKRNLPKNGFGHFLHSVGHRLCESLGERGLARLRANHPVRPIINPNPFYMIDPSQPGIFKDSKELQLLDAGTDINIPLYPLTHPSRPVDLILGVDASSDVMDGDFLKRYVNFADRKGIQWAKIDPEGRPIAEEAPLNTSPLKLGKRRTLDDEDFTLLWPSDPKVPLSRREIHQLYEDRYVEIYHGRALYPPLKPGGAAQLRGHSVPQATNDLYLAMMPLLPNACDPEFNPCAAEWCSTYNFTYEPEQVKRLIKTAEANFEEVEDKLRKLMRTIWQRKREARLARTKEEKYVE
ncbi:uncharacterized protein VTP21DRAFT_10734 [Calcarisporiella thermophila]|uniref:uncharacterized protein n=1 Tax=Calcarisporiella thermophila TaxID=911321 RepID=UPI0037444CD8